MAHSNSQTYHQAHFDGFLRKRSRAGLVALVQRLLVASWLLALGNLGIFEICRWTGYLHDFRTDFCWLWHLIHCDCHRRVHYQPRVLAPLPQQSRTFLLLPLLHWSCVRRNFPFTRHSSQIVFLVPGAILDAWLSDFPPEARTSCWFVHFRCFQKSLYFGGRQPRSGCWA